jgi:hypothetical protein
MVETKDGMLSVFRNRDDAAAREAYVAAQEKEADERRANEAKGKGKGQKKTAAKAAAKSDSAPTSAPKAAPKRQTGLITFALPESVAAGKSVTVKVNHNLPPELGEQVLTVTIKGGSGATRLDRKTVKARGTGVVEVTFAVPASAAVGVASFAAFVGEDYQKSLQHIQSPGLPTR